MDILNIHIWFLAFFLQKITLDSIIGHFSVMDFFFFYYDQDMNQDISLSGGQTASETLFLNFFLMFCLNVTMLLKDAACRLIICAVKVIVY